MTLPEDLKRELLKDQPEDVKRELLGDEDASRENGHGEYHPYHLTDLGNAQRLVARHGEDMRFCHPWGKWLVWDGTRWKVDDSAEATRRAVDTVSGIYAEAAKAEGKDERKAIAKHAAQSEGRSRIDAMLYLAEALPGIPVLPDEFDSDKWLLNVENGTIDLRSGELREHQREDLNTKIAPVEHDPDATAPTFERFLEQILPSEAVRDFLQRAVGYASTGAVTEEVLPILHGTGANGKTTLTGVLLDALGDYAIQAPPDLLMAKRDTHPTELTKLFGARLVVCMETEDGRRLAESLVKALTGREKITARRMREDFWTFEPTHTVFLGTNHKPEIRGTDHAIWRRPKLVPFDVTIPEPEQDKKLSEKLSAELPGVLAWIVRGCLDYQEKGLGVPEQVATATTGYRSEMDTLAAFFEDRCVIHDRAEVPATPLHHAYQEWCADTGERAETQKRFGMRLKERGFESFIISSGPYRARSGWLGIGLRDDRHDDPGGGHDGPPEGSSYASGSDSEPAAGVDDQTPTTKNKHHQDARNTPKSSGVGRQGPVFVDDPQHDESAIGTAKTPNAADGVEDSRPKSGINSSNLPRDGLMLKHGQHPQHPQQSNKEHDVHAVVGYLSKPPPWLQEMLRSYNEDPERFREPICRAVAEKALGTADRWEEVVPILRGDG